jgi:hypothetical protein
MNQNQKRKLLSSREETELLSGAAIFLGLALFMTILILGGMLR